MQETHLDSENEAVRVLFVEDDPIDRRLVERILCPCLNPVQFTVSSAESLAEAAESLKDKEYDVVLLDLGLPDSDGIETLRAISRENPYVPIVVLTGLNDEDTGLQAIENGATDYLAKELPLNMLLVRTILLAIQRKKTEQKARIMARFPQENPNPVLRISKARKLLDANIASSPILEKWGCQVGECLPETFCKSLYEALTSDKVCSLDFGWQDGRIFSLTFVPVTEEDYVNVYGLDVTDYRKAEKELKEAAEAWNSTFDSITDLVSVHDKEFKLVRVNKAFADTFGMKPQEIVGRTCYELVHGTDEPWPDCPLKCLLDGGKPQRKEFFEPRLGLRLEVSCSPMLDEDGELVGCIHITKDITNCKPAEETADSASGTSQHSSN